MKTQNTQHHQDETENHSTKFPLNELAYEFDSMYNDSLQDPEAWDFQPRGQRSYLRVEISEEPSNKEEFLAWRFLLQVQSSKDGKLGCVWVKKDESGRSFELYAPLPEKVKESYSFKEDRLKAHQIQTGIIEHAWARLRELGLPAQKVIDKEIGIPEIGEEQFPCQKP